MAVASSPLSSPPLSDPAASFSYASNSVTRYRPGKPLPFELAQYVQIYIEENLYSQALGFLTNLLSSNAAASSPSAPVLTPGSNHLALFSSLAIHPNFTSRTNAKDKWETANTALRLVRLTAAIVGPVNARFPYALAFTKYSTSRAARHRPLAAITNGVTDRDDDGADGDKIRSPYASTESLWRRAEDFWHVIGWALNCSCLGHEQENMYMTRWNWWQAWIEVLLDILEADFKLHFASQSFQVSMIAPYVTQASGGHGSLRRILRAIFADGSQKSLNEFPEVFAKELRPPKDDRAKIKKREVDVKIDEEVYGDYLSGGDDGLSDEDDRDPVGETGTAWSRDKATLRRLRTSSRRVTPKNSSSNLRAKADADRLDAKPFTLGSSASVNIRLRLLSLLSQLSQCCTTADGHTDATIRTKPLQIIDPDDMESLLTEFIRPLPLNVFRSFVLPVTPLPSIDNLLPLSIILPRTLLTHLLESSAPATHHHNNNSIDIHHNSSSSSNPIPLPTLVEDYLPYAAASGTMLDNAKVSLCLEALLRQSLSSHTLISRSAAKQSSQSRPTENVDIHDDNDAEMVKARLVGAVADGVERRINACVTADEDQSAVVAGRKGRKRKGEHGGDRRGLQQEEEQEAWEWLVESGERMAAVVNRS